MGAKSRRMPRKAKVRRRTTETDVAVELELDGQGRFRVETGLPFFDHMLAQLAKHGLFNLTLQAKGDLEVDPHHTMEDVGLALGEAFAQALGNRANIRRTGQATVPMDDALGWVAVDMSGRPFLAYRADG
ncbi:MAG: imidazoleglycerol-phosphate dehydratase, partial [Candidatus Methylomirabilales bacterium]